MLTTNHHARIALLAGCFANSVTAIHFLVSAAQPPGARWSYLFFPVFLTFHVVFGCTVIYWVKFTVVEVLLRVSIKRSLPDLLGGNVKLAFWFVPMIASIVGAIAFSIAFAVSVQSESALDAVLYYRILCGCISVLLAFLFGFQAYFLKKLATSVMEIEGTSPTHDDTGRDERMRRLVDKLNRSYREMRFTTPPVVLLWMIHAAILPMLWYMVIIHYLHTLIGSSVFLYLVTPSWRKRMCAPRCTTRRTPGEFSDKSTSPEAMVSASPKF